MQIVRLPITRTSLIKSDWLVIVEEIILYAGVIVYFIIKIGSLWRPFFIIAISYWATHRFGVGGCIPYAYTITDSEIELKCYENIIRKVDMVLPKDKICVIITRNNYRYRIAIFDYNAKQKAYTQYSSKWHMSSYWRKVDMEAFEQTLVENNYRIVRRNGLFGNWNKRL